MAKSRTPHIRRSTPVAKYYQIQLILQDRVESGLWSEGQAISSERDLCTEFGVSRPTIRQALANLVDEGFLRKEHGKGTFVAWPKLVEGTLTPAGRSTYQGWQAKGLDFEVKLLSAGVCSAPPNIRREFHLGANELVVRIERLLCVRENVIRHVVTFLPFKSCPDILEEDLTSQSLTSLLRDKYSMVIHESRQRLQAQPASPLDIHLMGISDKTPVFALQTVNFGSDGKPLWMDFDRSRSDRVLFEVTTSEDDMMKKKITTFIPTAVSVE